MRIISKKNGQLDGFIKDIPKYLQSYLICSFYLNVFYLPSIDKYLKFTKKYKILKLVFIENDFHDGYKIIKKLNHPEIKVFILCIRKLILEDKVYDLNRITNEENNGKVTLPDLMDFLYFTHENIEQFLISFDTSYHSRIAIIHSTTMKDNPPYTTLIKNELEAWLKTRVNVKRFEFFYKRRKFVSKEKKLCNFKSFPPRLSESTDSSIDRMSRIQGNGLDPFMYHRTFSFEANTQPYLSFFNWLLWYFSWIFSVRLHWIIIWYYCFSQYL